MRKPAQLGIFSLGALGLGLAATVPGAFAPPAAAQVQEPLCRRPAALPSLPPEPRVREDRQQARDRADGDRVYEPMMAPPAPPPPPEPSPPPPPPPVPMPMEASPESGGDAIVTGSRIDGAASESPAPVAVTGAEPVAEPRIAPGYYPGRPQPQSGLLTAGDHDDLLNSELYASYTGRFLQGSPLRDLPRVDTRRVLTVAVQDEAGRPVPFARVTITCADGNSLSLATVADGTAVFYPGLDRLGRSVRLDVAGAAG